MDDVCRHCGASLDAFEWVPRTDCGYFPAWLIAFCVAGPIWIAFVYFRIPAALLNLGFTLKPGKTAAGSRLATVLFWFGLFILSCGIGHLIADVLPFLYANYLMIGVWHFGTAIVSEIALRHFVKLMRHLSDSRDHIEELKVFVDLEIESLEQSSELKEGMHAERTRLDDIAETLRRIEF